jgi:hypothetical protein
MVYVENENTIPQDILSFLFLFSPPSSPLFPPPQKIQKIELIRYATKQYHIASGSCSPSRSAANTLFWQDIQIYFMLTTGIKKRKKLSYLVKR